VDMAVSYDYNIELIRAGQRVRRMARPEDRVIVFDGSMSGPDGGGVIGGDYQLDDADPGVLDRQKWLLDSAYQRQLKMIDVLYADGHAQRQSDIAPDALAIVPVW